MELDKDRVTEIIKSALKEDIGPLDITTTAMIQKNLRIRADIITNENGIVCGLPICETVFELLDKDIKFKPQVNEGDSIYADKVLCYLEGPARALLTGERTALNFLARLSGIATETHKFVERVKPYNVKIMDTRKTTPGLRYLERYAVRIGGGYNHRMGLWDQVLIKDNHLKAISCQPSAINKMLKDIRKRIQKNTKIEFEVGKIKDFQEALRGKPDIIMLDNMNTEDVKRALEMRNQLSTRLRLVPQAQAKRNQFSERLRLVPRAQAKRNEIGKRPLIEVSGNITIKNVEEYAKCKPDIISVGSITHSIKSLDVSMEVYG